MTAVLVGFRSGALYPLVLLVGAAVLAAAYGVLHVVAGLHLWSQDDFYIAKKLMDQDTEPVPPVEGNPK